MQSERIFYPDFLRVVAIFAVIILHICYANWNFFAADTFAWQVLNFYDGLTRWCVPVFFMLSGMFLLDFRRYGDDVSENFKRICKRNISRVALALVFWSIFYTYESMLLNHDFDPNPLRIFDMFFTCTMYHLWFLYVIIGLYILAPFLQLLVKNLSKKDFELLLIILAIFCCAYDFINVILKYFTAKTLHFRYNLPEFSGYLLYFLAGFYFANFEISQKAKRNLYILFFVGLFVTIVLNSLFALNHEKTKAFFYEYRLINVMFVSFGIFIFCKDFFSKISINTKFRTLINRLTSLSFGIYLLHVGILDILVQFFKSLHPLFMVPLFSVLIFVLSALLAFVISKIPLLNKTIF
ncbi:MAG: acyltransferase family protein [Campylobacter sp.]|nr:acyltransferase family protein [Campylobacter sp.]